MAHEAYMYTDGGDTYKTSANACYNSAFYLDAPNSYQFHLNFNYEDGTEQIDTIRRLTFSRRPRAKPQTGAEPSHWASSGSHSSMSKDEARNPSVISSSSVNRRKPPLPPSSFSKSNAEGFKHSEAPPAYHKHSDGKAPQAPLQPSTSKPNPLVERTLVETRKRLEEEKESSPKMPPDPFQRRRLASFGGLGSSSTTSPYTSSSALNQSKMEEKQKGSKLTSHDQTSLLGNSLRTSPKSSGKATPVAGVSPMHLQLVRDQMVVALERLKELEEQVKIIPVLQVRISVLQEEKRQLAALTKNQEGQNIGNVDADLESLSRKRAHSAGSAMKYWQHGSKAEKDEEGKLDSSEQGDGWQLGATSRLEEFKQLSAEMQLLEKEIENACVMTQLTSSTNAKDIMALSARNTGEDYKCLKNSSRDVGVETKLEMRSVAVEAALGLVPEAELERKKQTIAVLKDRVQTLEVELKDALLRAEMWRLKNELREAGARNRADKSTSAQPETQNTATQANAVTRTLGVGNHAPLVHAAVGEGMVQTFNTVGVTCRPETRDVASDPTIPIETCDQCVGNEYVATCNQGTEATVSVRDVGVVTLESMESLVKKKVSSRSVGCGDCTVDVNVSLVRPLVSKGMVTDPIRGIDFGQTPQTMSQCTNTEIRTVSRSTSTSQAWVSAFGTQERQTSTVHTITRSLAVGDGKISEQQEALNVRSIAVGTPMYRKTTAACDGRKVMTRDTGVGLANINDNCLVGLRTRNMACGPSRLPDPIKTRSIGVEVGDGRIRDMDGQTWTPVNLLQPQFYAQSEPGLDHYIDRMQRLLKEQESLLTSSHFKREEVTLQPQHLDDAQHGALSAPGHSPSSKANEVPKLKTNNLAGKSNGLSVDDGSIKSITKKKAISERAAECRKTLKAVSPGFDCLSINEDAFSDSEMKMKRGKDENLRATSKSCKMDRREGYKMSEKMLSACHSLKNHLNNSKALSNRELRSCLNTIQQEWFCVSSQKKACPDTVQDFLGACRCVSPAVLTHVANMADRNGNTALHYSVSHSNFRVVQKLLDAGVCNINQQNKAGYTPIMLAALASVESQEDMMVVEGLFRKGDVNAKAIQAGQTALMLAASHGRMDMVKVLLDSGSNVNIQDDEGSTALMCASEHGHADIVKLLLAQPGCDVTLTDNDESTALSIALEAGHKDIAMLLYAHMNYAKGQPVAAPRIRTPAAPAGRGLFD